MSGSGESRAEANRRIRREALREQLAAKGLVQHVIEISEKLNNLEGVELDSLKVQRLKAAADLKLSLVKKYLPDIKALELGGSEDGPPIKTEQKIVFVDFDDDEKN